MHNDNGKPTLKSVIMSMGLVFGDIGTSPLYTLSIIFPFIEPTYYNVTGIVSLIIWTLILLVAVEYTWLAMSLSRRGEGGTLILKEILVKFLSGKHSRLKWYVSILGMAGVSLLLGDGVITPAISILSAVEGVAFIPAFATISIHTIVAISVVIAFLLFAFQKRGSEGISSVFGPVMAIWFLTIAASGFFSIVQYPEILIALSPHCAVKFLISHGIAGFLILSSVILCATGGEALYADMGHVGKRPIQRAWAIVFPALCLSYIGQGAFLLHYANVVNPVFELMKRQISVFYPLFVLLAVAATVIASQALISGVFSVIYQGVTTRILPLIKVSYTSTNMKSQIYISSINWALAAAVITMIVMFKRSETLAAAFGLAVTGTMLISGILMTFIFSISGKKWKAVMAVIVSLVDMTFLFANFSKFSHGGYISLIIATIPFVVMIVWISGSAKLYNLLKPMRFDDFIRDYRQVRGERCFLTGTGLFFNRELNGVSTYIARTMLLDSIIYERNVLCSIAATNEPFGIDICSDRYVAEGLELISVHYGFMERLDLEKLLAEHNITEKVIFYGIEDIQSKHPAWKLFAFMKRNCPSFIRFHDLPVDKLQGVVMQVDMDIATPTMTPDYFHNDTTGGSPSCVRVKDA